MPGFCYLLWMSYFAPVNAPIPEPTFFLVLVIVVSPDDGALRFHLSVPVLSRDLLVTFGPERRNGNWMDSVNSSIKRFFSVTKGDRNGRHLDHVSGCTSNNSQFWEYRVMCGNKMTGKGKLRPSHKLCRKLIVKQHRSYLVRHTSNQVKLGQTHLMFLGSLFKLLLLLRPP